MTNLRRNLEAVIVCIADDLSNYWEAEEYQYDIDKDESQQERRMRIRAGHDWLRANLDHIVADAEIDKR